MNYGYQAAIVRALGRFVEQGLVYKGKKPVHWCTHCRTALAEAEVEYEDHTSPSIYVEFPLAPSAPDELAARIPALAGRDVSVLIWTTTPWTIPSNLAIAFHPDFDYGAYEFDGPRRDPRLGAGRDGRQGDRQAARRADRRRSRARCSIGSRSSIRSTTGRRSACSPTTSRSRPAPAWSTRRPGHGADDYATGVRYGLDVYAPVGPGGHYTDEVRPVRRACRCSTPTRRSRRRCTSARRLWHRDDVRAQLPALLALPQPGDLPGHVAVVHRHGSRVGGGRPAGTLRTQSLEAIKGVQWIPALGPGAHPQHAGQPARLVHLAPAVVGRADPGARLPGLPARAADAGAGRARRRRCSTCTAPTPGTSGRSRSSCPTGTACPSCGGTAFDRETNILDVWFDSGSSHEAVLAHATRR